MCVMLLCCVLRESHVYMYIYILIIAITEYCMFNYIPILMMMFENYRSAIFSMMTVGIDAYITIEFTHDHKYWIRLNFKQIGIDTDML